jgi:hypothetical protein
VIEKYQKAPKNDGYLGLKSIFLSGNIGFKEKAECLAQTDTLFLAMYGTSHIAAIVASSY